MSSKFKIGDRVTIVNSNIKGKVGTINYHDDNEEYVIICEKSGDNYYRYGHELTDEKPDKTEPSHYKNQSIETIDMMVRIWGAKAVVLFCEINAFKYRMRVGSKEGESIEDDIKKAQWYEQRANELRE